MLYSYIDKTKCFFIDLKVLLQEAKTTPQPAKMFSVLLLSILQYYKGWPLTLADRWEWFFYINRREWSSWYPQKDFNGPFQIEAKSNKKREREEKRTLTYSFLNLLMVNSVKYNLWNNIGICFFLSIIGHRLCLLFCIYSMFLVLMVKISCFEYA